MGSGATPLVEPPLHLHPPLRDYPILPRTAPDKRPHIILTSSGDTTSPSPGVWRRRVRRTYAPPPLVLMRITPLAPLDP
jgi:hypothetical protein